MTVHIAPKRGRGRIHMQPADLIGAGFARMQDLGQTLSQIASIHGVSRQAVHKDIARYRAAAVRQA